MLILGEKKGAKLLLMGEILNYKVMKMVIT
jgi:hypothetical protein